MIGVLDYGMGNVGSILNMLKRLSIAARLIERPAELGTVERFILPGVGAFDAGMSSLNQAGFREPLEDLVLGGRVPILGICLGMQLLARRSEEGSEPGLGWLPADVVRLQVDAPHATPRLKVPHMGWNVVTPQPRAALFDGYCDEIRFYFVHSYHVVCDREADVSAYTQYGGPVAAAIASGNIYGAQFHPEKSHRFGMQLLRNFSTC